MSQIVVGMKDFKYIPPVYADGTIKLHRQFYLAAIKALSIARRFNPLLDEKTVELKHFMLLVNFREEQPANALTGYFVFRNTVFRFLTATIDYALLLTAKDLRGLSISNILNIRKSYDQICLSFCLRCNEAIALQTEKPIFRVTMRKVYIDSNEYILGARPTIAIKDDIGLPFTTFGNIQSLKVVDIPREFTDTQYTLAGKSHYSPYATNTETYCAIYAETDNKYDYHAIKVLRWFPQQRTEILQQCKDVALAKQKCQRINHSLVKYTDLCLEENGKIPTDDETIKHYKEDLKKVDKIIVKERNCCDVFFELGYISKDENAKLHEFIVENDSRILFGKIKENKIAIIGGLNIFSENDFSYPLCIANIPLT